jgi:hypothetical protein
MLPRGDEYYNTRELCNSLSLCTEVDSSSSDSNNESTFEAEVLQTIITSEVVEEQPSSTESQTDERPAETHQAKASVAFSLALI